jgi:hypothetical protein
MKLQRREKVLLGASIALVVVGALYLLLVMGDPRSEPQLLADEAKYEGEINAKQKQLDTAAADRKKLANWQRRSLPAEPVKARSLYQNWLYDLATNTNFRQAQLTAQDTGTARAGQPTRVSFKLVGRTSLTNLVDFLYRFYSAGYLHQIRSLEAKPAQSLAANAAGELSVTIGIEALSLPTAESKSALPKIDLPKEPGHSLQLAKLTDYSPIAQRNFFSVYTGIVGPTRSGDRPPPPPRFDVAQFVEVTGIVEVDGNPQVWIQHKTKQEQSWKLGVGDTFDVGDDTGTVISINPVVDAVVEFRDHRRLLHSGENIVNGGVEIKDPLTPTAAPDTSAPERSAPEKPAVDKTVAAKSPVDRTAANSGTPLPADNQAASGGFGRGGGGRTSLRGRRVPLLPEVEAPPPTPETPIQAPKPPEKAATDTTVSQAPVAAQPLALDPDLPPVGGDNSAAGDPDSDDNSADLAPAENN